MKVGSIDLLKLLSPILFVIGLMIVVWSFIDSRFWNPVNGLNGIVCLPLAVGFAFLVNALLISCEWRIAGFWFAIAIIGQGVSLQLINAGPTLHYQHYRPVAEILNFSSPVVIGLLVFQIVVVLVALAYRSGEIWAWVRSNLMVWQLILITVVCFGTIVTVANDVSFYIMECLFAGALQAINFGGVLLFALSIPDGALKRFRERLSGIIGNDCDGMMIESALPDRFSVGLAIFVFILAASLNFFSYDRHPHVPDEVVYLTQARFIANGSLTLPAPPVPRAFETYLMMQKGDQWFPTTPPGWAMMLAFGELLGVPWLVNPFLAALNILLAYILLRALYTKRTARIAVFLLAVSPWYLFLGMSFMTHMFALTLALLAAIGVSVARRTGKSILAWFGGMALGMIFLVRPLEAVAMATLLGIWAIGWGGKRLKAAAIVGLVFGAIIVGGFGFWYNAHFTDDPFEFPINVYINEHFHQNANAYGFGPDRGMGWAIDPNMGHSPIDAVINTNLNVSTLNTELFGWSISSLFLIALYFCFAKFERGDYLMLAVVAVVYVLHFFYYFSGGPDFAARYWFLMIVPLVALSSRGLQSFADKLRQTKNHADLRTYGTVMVLSLMALLTFVPWRAIDKYHYFRGMRPDIRKLANKYNFGRSLVLVQGEQDPDFDSAMVYNPLDLLSDAPIYAWDRDTQTREKLLEAYSDRPVWLIRGPSLTHRGYEVVAGPLNANSFIQHNDE